MDGGGCRLSKIDSFISKVVKMISQIHLKKIVFLFIITPTLLYGGISATMAGIPLRISPLTQDVYSSIVSSAGLIVKEVTLEGRIYTPSELVLDALTVERGDLITNFNPRTARKRIEEISWVETAEVRLDLPHKISVRIKERMPFVRWQNNGQIVLIDREGEVLTGGDLSQFDELITVVGIDAPINADALINMMEEYPTLLDQIQAAVRVGKRRWNLHFNSGLIVKLPEIGLEEAWLRFVNLENQYSILSREAISIDLRLPNRLFILLPDDFANKFGIREGGV